MHISNMCKNDLLKKRFPTWKLKLEEVVGTKEVQHLVQQLIIFFINNQNLISKKYAYLLYVYQVQMIYTKKKAFIIWRNVGVIQHCPHTISTISITRFFLPYRKTWLKRERISKSVFCKFTLYIMGLLDDNPCTSSYGEKKNQKTI